MKRWTSLLLLCVLSACDTGESLQRMNHQSKEEAYAEDRFFPDGASMRTPPPGTVPRGTDLTDGVPVTADLLARGRNRYGIYCAACHGVLGDGKTVVASHMRLRPPPSLQDRRELSPARLYDVIARGYGLMPSYAAQLPDADRWAVVAYVEALELSQSVALDALPAAIQSEALSKLSPGEK